MATSTVSFLTPLAAASSDGLDQLFGTETTPLAGADPSIIGSTLKMLGALGVVLALLLLTLLVLKRLSGKWTPPLTGSKGGGIEVLQQRSLGGRRTLTVVRWEGRRLLLGVTGDAITALASEPEAATPEEQAFQDELQSALGHREPVALEDTLKSRRGR